MPSRKRQCRASPADKVRSLQASRRCPWRSSRNHEVSVRPSNRGANCSHLLVRAGAKSAVARNDGALTPPAPVQRPRTAFRPSRVAGSFARNRCSNWSLNAFARLLAELVQERSAAQSSHAQRAAHARSEIVRLRAAAWIPTSWFQAQAPSAEVETVKVTSSQAPAGSASDHPRCRESMRTVRQKGVGERRASLDGRSSGRPRAAQRCWRRGRQGIPCRNSPAAARGIAEPDRPSAVPASGRWTSPDRSIVTRPSGMDPSSRKSPASVEIGRFAKALH